jgi:DNA-binding MarR family transcriptional regulator
MTRRGEGTGGREAAVPAEATLDQLLARLEERYPGLEGEAVRSALAVGGLCARILTLIDAHFGRYDLSQVRFTVLMILYHFADQVWTPAALARTVRVSRPTVTGVLQVLERDGWVERRPDPSDGRRVQLRLTASGRKRFSGIMDDHFKRVIAAFEPLQDHDHAALRDGMAEMAAAFEALAGEET